MIKSTLTQDEATVVLQAKPRQDGAIRAFLRRQDNWNIIGLIITLIVVMAIASIASPYFMTVRNWLNIGQAISIRGIIAIGLTIVLITGGLDLSIAAVAAVAGMAAAALINAEVNGWLAAILALLLAGVLGAINGTIIVKFRINPIIATLGTLLLFRGLAYVVSGGKNIVIGVNTWSFLGRGFFLGIPVSLIIYLVMLVLAYLFLRFTITGNYIYAIGGNSEACRNSGIQVDRLRFGVYIFTAMLSGIAGLILMSQAGTATPIALSGAELDIIAAVLLGGIALSGGRGSLVGTFLGSLLIGVINNALILTQVQIYWQMVARGILLIIAVTLDSLRRGGGYR
jgi:ribose/xylose/arabinose/galactoside ABC-type transport system permease subunit